MSATQNSLSFDNDHETIVQGEDRQRHCVSSKTSAKCQHQRKERMDIATPLEPGISFHEFADILIRIRQTIETSQKATWQNRNIEM